MFLTPPVFALMLLAQSMFGGLPIDGIRCDTSEGAVEHIHADLQIYDRGHAATVPAGVGIPVDGHCLYWVHTHVNDGIIHIEAPVKRPFSLGQFFDIWGSPLSRTMAGDVHAARGRMLRVTVNGKTWRGNPRSIALRDRETILIEAGPPYARARSVDWSKL